MRPNNDLEALAEPFKARAQRLVELLERDGLPFVVFETRRSFSRSAELYMQGREVRHGLVVRVGRIVTNARSGESPHNWGLAIDCILNPKSDWWDDGERATGPWDNGYDGKTLARPLVKLAWERYGRCVRQADLNWGGDFASVVDLPHAELKGWRALRPSNWKETAAREVAAGR